MNNSEFNAWWTNYAAAFPETLAWLKGLPNDGGRSVLHGWRSALADTDAVAAARVIALMVAGDVDAVKPYERELTAAKVRAAAEPIRLKMRAASLPPREEPPTGRQRRPFPFGSVFRELCAMQERGASEAERLAWLNRAVPPIDDRDTPRFHCRFCCDSGHLDVVHPRLVEDYQRGGRELADAGIYRTAAIRCSCARGARSDKDPCAIFRPNVHCRVVGGDTNTEEFWASFAQWHADALEAHQADLDRRHEWNPQRQQEAFA